MEERKNNITGIVECRIGFIGAIIGDVPFFALTALGLIGRFTLTQAEIASGRDEFLNIFIAVVLLAWLISRFSFIPSLKVLVSEDGIHGFIKIRFGSFNLVDRHRYIKWTEVDRFEWFNSGFLTGYMIYGKDQSGKKVYLGASIFFTNSKQAAKAILDFIPKHKVDKRIYEKLGIAV